MLFIIQRTNNLLQKHRHKHGSDIDMKEYRLFL